MKIESILYDKLFNDSLDNKCSRKINKQVKCNICSQKCIVNQNSFGFCNTRKNEKGKLYSYNFAVVSSNNPDPIEKKPIYHFMPNTLTYSIGGFGCNMKCLNCQNYMISQYSYKDKHHVEIFPKKVVEIAIDNGCQSIAWTYNEPTMYLEYILETALISHENGLKNIYVSNGYMSEESLALLLPKIDAFNIDLKYMSNGFYKKYCQATLEPILNNIKTIYKNNNHIELTNLLINGLNDSNEMIKLLVDFVANELGKEVPIHFSRFFPYYKMENIPATDIEKLKKAKEIATDIGLKYVYLGNVPIDQNSYCPNCGELLIKRNGYLIEDKKKIKNNKCTKCNEKLNFIT